MAPDAMVAALGGCLLVTSIELSYRNQRHPFGDKRQKAAIWWLVVSLVDCAACVLILLGVLAADVGVDVPGAGREILAATLVGVLGPLGLRSPIRKAEVAGRESGVGVTYVYDLARLNALSALDERLVRLRRRDVTRLRVQWLAKGLTPSLIAEEVRSHISDHERMDVSVKEEIAGQITACLTLPKEENQADALIKLIRSRRLKSMLDEFIEWPAAATTPGRG